MAGLRLKGQEISIRVVRDGQAVDTVDSVSNFNDEVGLEVKEEGFLGEVGNRFDEIFNGFGGDFEMQLTKASWIRLVNAIVARAQRKVIGTVFNVVRSDLFSDGSSLVYTYKDVKWGPIPQNVGQRGDYVKVKMSFKTDTRVALEDAV